MSVEVTVLGPNWINDADFHVHASGCADIRRPKYRMCVREGTWDVEVCSKRELFETLFGDFISENEGEDWGGVWTDYLNQARIFPCVGVLADEA
jgi:hypothetical protein